MEQETETRKVNRHKAQVPRKVATWCPRCDQNHVTEYGKNRKCDVCGFRNDKIGKKRFK